MDVNQLRKKVDSADSMIVSWLCRRQKLVRKIAEAKKSADKGMADRERESAIVRNAAATSKNQLGKQTIRKLYREVIFPDSYRLYKNVRAKKHN